MKKISFLIFIISIDLGFVKAGDKQIVSPDGKLSITVSAEGGKPIYSISYNGNLFLKQSPLGLKTNVSDLSMGLTAEEKVSQRKINETYELPNIKQSKVSCEANERVFPFLKDNKAAFDVVFRVSNNDVAFKYKIYPRKVCNNSSPS